MLFRGPVDEKTRTFPVPFDEKLRKKKKYKKILKGSRDHVVAKMINIRYRPFGKSTLGQIHTELKFG